MRTNRIIRHLAIALFAGGGGTLPGCSDDRPHDTSGPHEPVSAQVAPLSGGPSLPSMAVLVDGSLRLLPHARIDGGHVGAAGKTVGPRLAPGFDVALGAHARVDTDHDLVGRRVLLGPGASVGVVHAEELTVLGGSYTSWQPLVELPELPPAAAVTTGTSSLTVGPNQTVELPAGGRFATVLVKPNGRLRVGGLVEAAELTIGPNAKLEASAPLQVRVARGLMLQPNAFVGPRPGSGLTAGDIRLEVSGVDGATGQVDDWPKAVQVEPNARVTALVLARNGTVWLGPNAVVTGAIAARDASVGANARVQFEGGFPSTGGCVPADCDDGNVCTIDACEGGVCTHAAVADGTACNDGDACTQTDTCVAGVCTGTNAVVCTAIDQCHEAGTCDPATGACSNPAKADGTACNDGNACTQTDTCVAGVCTGANAVVCTAIDQCHEAGTCDPATGACSNPVKADGTPCPDNDACNGLELCDASGSCLAGVPPGIDDGNPCTVDTCDPVRGVSHESVVAGTPCGDMDACNGEETCDAFGACVAGTPPAQDDGDPCTSDWCDPVRGVQHDRIAGCGPTQEGAPLETRASIVGTVQAADGTPVTNVEIRVYDAPVSGPSRADVEVSQSQDGSFRARLTGFAQTRGARDAPVHVIVDVRSDEYLPATRDAYLDPGKIEDVGVIRLMPRDPAVTWIGPEGGTASDSEGLVQVVIPAGATPTSVPVRITPIKQRELIPLPLPDATLTTYAFELEPDGAQFSAPVTVRVSNWRNVPTTLKIPVGYASRSEAKWVHVGLATWDGSRFAFQTTHFSPYDCNGSDMGVLVVSVQDKSNDSARVCAGSTVGIADGSLGQTFHLPTVRRLNTDDGVTLTYDSGLAGSRVWKQSMPGASSGAIPHTSVGIQVGGLVVSSMCMSRGAANSTVAGNANSCQAGTCSLNGSLAPYALRYELAGQRLDEQGTLPAGATVTDIDSAYWLPMSGGGVAPSGFHTERVAMTIGSGSCAGGGIFGSPAPLPGQDANGTQTTLDPGPSLNIERQVLVYHRIASPYGAGWGIAEVGRVFRNPNAEHAVFVSGAGAQEEFRPRISLTELVYEPNLVGAVGRDPVTGELFEAVSSGAIYRLDPQTWATTTVDSGTFGRPYALAVSYAGGVRRFVVAARLGLFEVASGVTRQLATRAGNDNNSVLPSTSVAVRGDYAFYTDGQGATPYLYRVDLTAASPVLERISHAVGGGNLTLDPDAPVSEVTFTAPIGLAFGDSGELYVADRARNAIYRLQPQADGTIGPSSEVGLVAGDGMGRYVAPIGDWYAAERFSLPRPEHLTMTPDGYLFVVTGYGIAMFDPQARRARWWAHDSMVPSSDMAAQLQTGFPSFLALDSRTVLRRDEWRLAKVTDDGLASVREPTRTLAFDTDGRATITDTQAQTVEHYDVHGRLVARHKRSGELMLSVMWRDGTGDAIDRIVDASGGQTVFGYDANGKLESITDAAHRTTHVTVGSDGDLLSLTLPDGEQWQFEYQAHHMIRKRSPRSDETSYVYRDHGTLQSTHKPTGETFVSTPAFASTQVASNGERVYRGSYTDAHGVDHDIVVDRAGQVVTDTFTADGIAKTVTMFYAPQLGRNTAWQGARRNKIYRPKYWTLNGAIVTDQMEWDSLGRLVAVQRQWGSYLQNRVSYKYDSNGWLSNVLRGPSSTSQQIERDASGHIVRVWDRNYDGTATGRQTLLTWNRADGQPDTITAHGITTQLVYDNDTGNLLSATSSAGQTSLSYDSAGNVVYESDGTASKTFDFDANNRLLSVVDAEGNETRLDYVQIGCGCTEQDQLASVHTPDLPPHNKWQLIWQPDGRLGAVIDPSGAAESYEYEVTGELKKVVDRLQRETRFTHDELGRLTSTVDIAGRTHVTAHPEVVGGVVTGAEVTAMSDSATPAPTSLTAVLGPGQVQVGQTNYLWYGLDGMRQVSAWPQVTFYRDATFELSYGWQYDLAGRTQRREDRPGLPASSSTVFGTTTPTSNVHLSYEPTTSDPLPSGIESSYDGGYESGTWTRNAWFDVVSAQSPITHQARRQYAQPIYTRDSAGRITAIDHGIGYVTTVYGKLTPAPTSRYSYTSNGYLASVENPAGKRSYGYDSRGLVHTVTVDGEGQYVYEYDPLGRNRLLLYPDGHRRVQAWDERGRLVSRCYEYDE
jgi:YD repeat-containing protein